MGLDRCHIAAFSIATVLGMFVLTMLFPWAKLLFFAPLMVTLFYQKPLPSCLFWAFGFGLVVDLLGDDARVGIYACNYCVTTALLYGQKRNFFADSISTLPLMTLFFSLLSSVGQLAVAKLLHPEMLFSLKAFVSHAIAMPLLDGFYAFTFFTLPLLLIKGRPRSGKEYFIS